MRGPPDAPGARRPSTASRAAVASLLGATGIGPDVGGGAPRAAGTRTGPGHLESLAEQTVRIEALQLDLAFAKGERIHTESSHKYSLEEIDALAARSGFEVADRWLDSGERFSLQLLRPA